MTLTGTSWLLEPADDGAGRGLRTPSLDFHDDGQFHAHTGVNHVRGTYAEDGDRLTLHPGPTTLMAGPPELMEQERELLVAFAATATWSQDGERLTLLDRAGDVLLRYRAALRALPGTAWRAAGVNNGHQAVVTTALTPTVTLEFSREGQAFGSTGLNRLSAEYRATDRTLTFGPVAVTRRAGLPEVMELERQVLDALARVARWATDGDHVVLQDAAGATEVVLVPDVPQGPEGSGRPGVLGVQDVGGRAID